MSGSFILEIDMALTEEQLKELALRVDAQLCSEGHVATSAAYAIAFAANLIAALPKPEPVAWEWVEPDRGMCISHNEPPEYEVYQVKPLYTEAPIAQPASAPSEQKAETFQSRVEPWLLACFGEEISNDKEERNHRFLEESLELVQATGCTASEAHQLVDYVFGRPVGEPHQEVGGVMVTLAALCRAQALDMHANGEIELARIWTKVEKIRAKQAAKPKHSPLPEATAPQPDYKAQRDALLEALDQVSASRNIGSAHIIARAAIASVKGGE